MKGKQVFIVIGVVIFITAVIVAVASSSSFNTPLYTVRMEQVSSKMNFLPKEANQFIYTAIKGQEIFFNIKSNGIFDDPPETEGPSCDSIHCNTCGVTECGESCGLECETMENCPTGDPETCGGASCTPTCGSTCDDPTCYGPTCPFTCYQTMVGTCCTCYSCDFTCFQTITGTCCSC